MNKLKTSLLFIICIICSYSNIYDSNNSISNESYSILFIGNSLTYTNNLPELVKIVAKERGITIRSKMIAFPNYSIIDHWDNGSIQQEIAKNSYDFVIFQQGPSSRPYGREILIKYGKKLSNLCHNNNAKLGYFMVWPSLSYYHTFEDVIKNHRDASVINDAILFPVGEVWKRHFDLTKNFDYYSSDGFHPSMEGSKVAAKIIVEYLIKDQI